MDALAKLTPHVLRKFKVVVESTAERTTQKKVQLTSEICSTVRNFVYDKLLAILKQASARVRRSSRHRIETRDLFTDQDPAGMLAIKECTKEEQAEVPEREKRFRLREKVQAASVIIKTCGSEVALADDEPIGDAKLFIGSLTADAEGIDAD